MLIEIDGPSGAGKTSLVSSLRTDRQFAGRPVVDVADVERATGDLGWRTGALMRETNRGDGPIDPVEAVFLYCARTAARARLVAGLNNDRTVLLCDRLRLSLDVQARLAGLAPPHARSAVDLAVRQVRPDLLVLLDVTHPVHAHRLAARGHTAQSEITFGLIRSHFAAAFAQFTGTKLRIDTTRLSSDDVHRAVLQQLPLVGVAR
ncbi:MAG: hypothetical protein HYR62_06105 [Actinobacteria bacterium]|nr:hypothetical protein [Actinomycetota bacterium]